MFKYDRVKICQSYIVIMLQSGVTVLHCGVVILWQCYCLIWFCGVCLFNRFGRCGRFLRYVMEIENQWHCELISDVTIDYIIRKGGQTQTDRHRCSFVKSDLHSIFQVATNHIVG